MKLVNHFLMAYEALYAVTENLSTAEPDEATDAQAIATQIAQKMASILDAYLYSGDPAEQKLLDEIRYLLTVLVDEILLFQVSWPGGDYWGDHTLEKKLFGTSVAGRKIFERINTLGKRHSNTGDKEQLASIYLMLLQLGFHGECRHQHGRLTEYQSGLNTLRSQPDLPSQAFTQAYGHLLQGTYPHTHRTMSRWWRGVGIALGVYLFLTLILWFSAVYIFSRVYDDKIHNNLNAGAQTTRLSSIAANTNMTIFAAWQGVS